MIAERSGGFLYCVSLVGVTGARSSLPADVAKLVRDVRAVSPVPVGVGFGVSRPAHVRALAKAGADGVIVASALVDALGEDGRESRRSQSWFEAFGRREPPQRPEDYPRGVSHTSGKATRLEVVIEAGDRKVFASALDWPGWSRSAKTRDEAIERLLTYAPRYAPVAKLAKLDFPDAFDVEVVQRLQGDSGTDFGVPSRIHAPDTARATKAEADRLARIVEAAWTTFDRVAAGAPAKLRKGPRGGGRDRDKMVGHVIESDWYYARELGLKLKAPSPDDPAAIKAMREDMLAVLRQPSDGSPVAGRTWTPRYAARRIAWHSIDHAWEMEDRSE